MSGQRIANDHQHHLHSQSFVAVRSFRRRSFIWHLDLLASGRYSRHDPDAVMSSQQAMFTATRLQTLTYLLAVCPFSIAFLVFINSSLSFVVTDLIGLHDGEGDAVGTLGFADELLALAACPIWGVLSDRIGVRNVSIRLCYISPDN